jgi:restriction endonuclease S subunit
MTDIPNGWEQKRFGDIFRVKYGKAIDKSLREDSAQYPVVGSAGVMTYTKIPLTREPTIVIGRKGNVGSIQVFKDGCYPIDTTYYMHSSNEYDLDFLTHLLTSLQLVKLDSSTATPSLRREDLEDVQLVIPPLPEQLKIVEILEDHLSRLDAALADVKQAKVKATQFRRSLLQAAFTGNLASDGTRLMTPNAEAWLTVELQELVEVLDNQRVPVNSSERAKRIGDVPYYGATGQVGTIDKAIFNEELLILGEDGVQFFDPNKPKAYKISGPSWVNNHAHVLRPHRNRVDLQFLLHFLNHFNYVGFANGTTRLKLTQGAMKQIPVPIPPLPEQHKIVEILEDHLSRLDASIALADAMEKQSAGLRRSLLQAAFTGQLTNEVVSV